MGGGIGVPRQKKGRTTRASFSFVRTLTTAIPVAPRFRQRRSPGAVLPYSSAPDDEEREEE